MKYLWTEDTGAGLHFWKLVNQLFFDDEFVVESKRSNQGWQQLRIIYMRSTSTGKSKATVCRQYNKNIVRCEHDESCKFYLHLTMFPQILLLVRLFGQYGMSA